jgi:nitrogen fixation-related uncharacterized protein
MSEHKEHQHHDHQEPETSSIKARPVLAFMVILSAATAFVFVLIWGLLWALDRKRDADETQPATRVEMPEGQRRLPPEPRLQGAPGPDGPSLLPLDDWRVYKEMTDKMVASYGWVDKNGAVARIPVERAKELVAAQGLPMLSDKMVADIERSESTRKAVLGADSSAGRLLRSVAPAVGSAVAPVAGPTDAGQVAAPAAPVAPAAPQH